MARLVDLNDEGEKLYLTRVFVRIMEIEEEMEVEQEIDEAIQNKIRVLLLETNTDQSVTLDHNRLLLYKQGTLKYSTTLTQLMSRPSFWRKNLEMPR